MEKKPWVIFLNGTSSSGKSSTAAALQNLFSAPCIHIGVDTFLFLMPSRYLFEGAEAHLGYNFIRVDDHEGSKVIVENGPFAHKLNQVKLKTMKSLLEADFNLIIDEVLYSESDYHEYRSLLKGYRVTFVGIKPPLEVAVERERARGDRLIGLARGLHTIVHANMMYDLIIDTSIVTPEESAKLIHNHVSGRM